MRKPDDRWGDAPRGAEAGDDPRRAPWFGGWLGLWARFPGALRRVAATGEPEVLSYRGRVLGAVISISDLERLRELEAAGQETHERASE